MATLETRDFLRIIDYHYLHSSSSSSPSSSSPLHLSLRVTESDCSNNAERVFELEEATTTDAAMNDTSTTLKNISPLDVLMPALLRDSIALPKIPLKRKASLARFLQMRNERVRNLRFNGCNSSSDKAATFLQLKSERKSETIPADIEFEFKFKLYVPSSKRQCLQSLEAQ